MLGRPRLVLAGAWRSHPAGVGVQDLPVCAATSERGHPEADGTPVAVQRLPPMVAVCAVCLAGLGRLHAAGGWRGVTACTLLISWYAGHWLLNKACTVLTSCSASLCAASTWLGLGRLPVGSMLAGPMQQQPAQ